MKKIIYIGLIGFVFFKLGVFGGTQAKKTEFIDSYGNMVVLYGTSWCGYCKKTRALLEKNNIDYIDLDIENSTLARDEYKQLNGRGVPLILIAGEIVRGYDPQSILRLAK